MVQIGISFIVSSLAAVLLCIFFGIQHSVPTCIAYPILHLSVVGFVISIAAHPSVNYTSLFRKSPEGVIPWSSYVIFGPYLLLLRVHLAIRRYRSYEPRYTEVGDGLFVGAWPTISGDIPPGLPAIIDCTCELPRMACTRQLPYLCIHSWDSRSPGPDDIEDAVRWGFRMHTVQDHGLFIHCANGHGRSVTVMCALLVVLRIADTWQTAEKLIKERRPKAHLNQVQAAAISKWHLGRQRRHIDDPSKDAREFAVVSGLQSICEPFQAKDTSHPIKDRHIVEQLRDHESNPSDFIN